MYREEIITIQVLRVSPRGLLSTDGRFFPFPKPIRFIDEIIKPNSIVSFIWLKTKKETIYSTAGDPAVCKFYIKQILKIN